MPHDAPAALEVLTADYLDTLDQPDGYTPTLTGSTTNPNLGSSGEAVGWYHRIGHRITGGARFLFSGTGLSAGAGVFEISLPFPADTGFMTASTAVGTASVLGNGFLRDAGTAANSVHVLTSLVTANVMRMYRSGSNGAVGGAAPFTWEEDDRISVNFEYLADSAGLP